MPDAPVATPGARIRVWHPGGSWLRRPGCSRPSDPRHPTTRAGIVTTDDQLYRLGPDLMRDGIHLASPSCLATGPQCRMVYFGQHELVVQDAGGARSLHVGPRAVPQESRRAFGLGVL
jgi:hypothetical protein